mgnify:CR=1 FL=1
MQYRDYIALVEYDDVAKVFCGRVINTRDIITFEGTTVGELQQAFEDSVDDYLDFCAERWKEPQCVDIRYGIAHSKRVK